VLPSADRVTGTKQFHGHEVFREIDYLISSDESKIFGKIVQMLNNNAITECLLTNTSMM